MKVVLLWFTVALAYSSSHGFVYLNVHLKHWDVQQQHKFFPLRVLEEENMTIVAIEEAVRELSTRLNESMFKVVDFQIREMEIAMMEAADTHDDDCIRGLNTYMDKAVRNAITDYEDCTEEVLPRLLRSGRQLESRWVKYNTTYTTTLSGLKLCTDNYSYNQHSRLLIDKCLTNREKNYCQHSSLIERTYNTDSSPAMRIFNETVIECIGNVFSSVVDKGFEFLRKMKCCMNSTAIEHWHPVKNTLRDQIQYATERTKLQTNKFETYMKTLHKRLLTVEEHLNSLESPEMFDDVTSSLLNKYYQSVFTAAQDNPGDTGCVDDAEKELRYISKTGDDNLYDLHKTMKVHTSLVLVRVTEQAEVLKSKIRSIGNVAILKCFSQGYIFAPNTIRNCFDLTYNQFDLSFRETINAISEDEKTLDKYLSYFQNRMNYSSVTFLVQRQLLEADRILHELQRCLYKSSATIYSVTTPEATTTTIPISYHPSTSISPITEHSTHPIPEYYDEEGVTVNFQ